MSTFTDSVVANCRIELARFDGGKLLEGDAKVYKRIGEHWKAIPVQGIEPPRVARSSIGSSQATTGWPARFR